MLIRQATPLDRDSIRELYLRAFPDTESRLVAKLADRLLCEPTNPETISLVAEVDEVLAGHVAFSPVTVDSHGDWIGYILAPLAVLPEYQRKRVGSRLVEQGIAMLSDKGINVVFVYGDPGYYARFGFDAGAADDYLPPYELEYPFGWLARVIRLGASIEQPASCSCVDALRDPALW